MISKETFVETMLKLKRFDEKVSEVDKALRGISEDFCRFYMFEPFEIPIDLMEEMFNDTEVHWLSYLVWERNWLEDFELGDIVVNDECVDLSDWGKVYDFLINNMNDE